MSLDINLTPYILTSSWRTPKWSFFLVDAGRHGRMWSKIGHIKPGLIFSGLVAPSDQNRNTNGIRLCKNMYNWNMYHSKRKGRGNTIILHTEISCLISSKAKESKRKIKGKNTIFQFMSNLSKYLMNKTTRFHNLVFENRKYKLLKLIDECIYNHNAS